MPSRPSRSRFKTALRWAGWTLLVLLAWVGAVCGRVVHFGAQDRVEKADAIIVLGASAWRGKPSPAFAGRIRHGVELWKKGIASKLIFTGGLGHGDVVCESEAARRVAIEAGVPESAILIEKASRFTWENLVEAQRLMEADGLKTAVIVSDPDHLLRASIMADDLHLAHTTSPTPYSAFQTWKTRAPFVLSEMWQCHLHKLRHWTGSEMPKKR